MTGDVPPQARCAYCTRIAEEPAGTCASCNQPVYHRAGKPGEFNHDCSGEYDVPPEPECETCGGEGTIDQMLGAGIGHIVTPNPPCPDCQEEDR